MQQRRRVVTKVSAIKLGVGTRYEGIAKTGSTLPSRPCTATPTMSGGKIGELLFRSIILPSIAVPAAYRC
jgi:hypothetical protein